MLMQRKNLRSYDRIIPKKQQGLGGEFKGEQSTQSVVMEQVVLVLRGVWGECLCDNSIFYTVFVVN